jgi:predicted ATPase/DNA-binding XRE family transcriptional regulator
MQGASFGVTQVTLSLTRNWYKIPYPEPTLICSFFENSYNGDNSQPECSEAVEAGSIMNNDAGGTDFLTGEEDFPLYFSEWLKRRRQELDLTQVQLAKRASCTVFTIRKIEAGERRPSKQLAGLLAKSLEIPPEAQSTFIKVARGELSVEKLVFHVSDSQSAGKTGTLPMNLPRELTAFIGREPELTALAQLLHDPQCSLITIVGPGGIGKTRLAIEVATRQRELFPDGVWFVPLAPLSSSEYLIPAIADALKFRFQDPAKPKEQLLKFLHNKRSLLVLDNVEHLLDGAGLFTEILKSSSQVKLLVTSRERVNLLSEWVFEIHGLPVPSHDQAEQFEEYSSVALFLQSARRVQTGFQIRGEERRWALNICRTMEGMPLGIELSAAWVGLLSCEEIAKEIEHNIDFLSVSMQDLPERHRSIRAVFDHSWKMLTVDEQQVMCQLSVFQGGFQRQAAEQVAGASLPILSTLVNRTLLRRVATGRYALHELVRQYSADHLAADSQAHAAAQQRHYAYFLALVETAEKELKGSNQLEWLEWLEQDYSNIRVALEWALKSDRGAPGEERALRLAGALRWFWRMRGHFHEGRDWLMQALQTCSENPTVARASALLGLSMIMNILGDLGAALPQAEESAAIFRELGDQRGMAEALSEAGATLVWQGETTMAFARFEKALSMFRKAGDRWGEAQVLYRLGGTLVDYSSDSTGREMVEESARILEDLGEKYLYVYVLISLGVTEIELGNYPSARTRLEQGLAAATEIKHPGGVADALTYLGYVFRIQGEYLTAQSHFEAAYRVYQEHGSSVWETDVLCALAENDIAQGDLSTARLHIVEASNHIKSSENKLLNSLVCYFRGLLAYYEGDNEGSAELLGEALALVRKGTYKPEVARTLIALARVRRALGEVIEATDLVLEGLDLFSKYGHKLGVAIALEELAAVCAVNRDCARAVMLLSVAHALRERIGAPLPPVDRTAHDCAVEVSRTHLGESGFASIWADASTRRFQEVVEEILKNKGFLYGT